MGVENWRFGDVVIGAHDLRQIYQQMGSDEETSRLKAVETIKTGWAEPLPGAKIEGVENRATFLARLEGLVGPEDLETIDLAYDLAKEAHRPQLRDGGQRYFEHCRATALILIDELGMVDVDLICTMLLHDVGEDSALFGAGIVSYEELVKKMRFRVTKIFNERVAENLIILTKPNKQAMEFTSKNEIKRFYFERLAKAPTEVVLCKACDRLHNLRTLEAMTLDGMVGQIKQTEEYLLPILEGRVEDEKYSDQMKYLVENIHMEIQNLKTKYQI